MIYDWGFTIGGLMDDWINGLMDALPAVAIAKEGNGGIV